MQIYQKNNLKLCKLQNQKKNPIEVYNKTKTSEATSRIRGQ